MNRSTRLALANLVLALGTVFAIVTPSRGWAGTPYSLHWARTEFADSCETVELAANSGHGFLTANETPLPTYDVPGSLMTFDDGSVTAAAEAGFDSVLLRMGANDFSFVVTKTDGNNTCVHSHEVVNLVSVSLGLNKPVFDIGRAGAAFSGLSAVDLSLAEINPPLARDIANLETAIANEQASLIQNASMVADLAARESVLQQLHTELTDLANRPIDEIAQTDLDAILDRYASIVDPETRAALEQLLGDLQKSVTDLETELASLIDNFGAQADAVVDLATADARADGFSPDDPANYALGANDVPWVDVPDISGVPGAFTPGNDPYALYADKVITQLSEDVSLDKVRDKASFVATVRAWRANEAALQKAILTRVTVSQAETSAFLNGQNKVTHYVHLFMDNSDWFLDSAVPPYVRSYIDGVLKQGFDNLSDEMKDHLNSLQVGDGDTVDLSFPELFDTIAAFGGAMSAIGDNAKQYRDVMESLVMATTRIGVGFVPVVGPVLDLCECVTGKAWCMPSGKDLSDEERIFSGAGFAIGGVVQVWGGVKNAGLKPAAMLIADNVEKVDEAIAKGLHANPRTWYKTLRGGISSQPLDPFEKVAGKYLQEDGRALIGIGDDGVRKVLGIPKKGLPYSDVAKSPDFLSVTKGNKLALSEVKSIEISPDGSGGIDAEMAVRQLTNAIKKMRETGLVGDLERVEIIMPKGASFWNKNYIVKNDYLFDTLEHKPVGIKNVEGLKNVFVMVIEL